MAYGDQETHVSAIVVDCSARLEQKTRKKQNPPLDYCLTTERGRTRGGGISRADDAL